MTETLVCPKCDIEFYSHVTACSDCGSTLVPIDAPDPTWLPFSEDLIAIADLDPESSHRLLDALTEGGVPYHIHTFTDAELEEIGSSLKQHEVAPLLLVRAEDEKAATRIAREVAAPTRDASSPLLEGREREIHDAWFETPDLMPGPEEEAAARRANNGLWLLGVSLMVALFSLLGAFGGGGLSTFLIWIGAAGAAAGLSRWLYARDQRIRLRKDRERTPVGIATDGEEPSTAA